MAAHLGKSGVSPGIQGRVGDTGQDGQEVGKVDIFSKGGSQGEGQIVGHAQVNKEFAAELISKITSDQVG